MESKRVFLRDDDAEIYLDVYLAEGNAPRKALLILPGGAYGYLSDFREGTAIAETFLSHGFQCFVLHYTVERKRPFPAQLLEATKAIVHIKDNATRYGIDPEKVFVVGFSAGGHLAACCGTLWKHPAIAEEMDIPYGYNKPRGMMLIYPVITGHRASFYNLLCKDDASEEELDALRLENKVDEDTVPAFIMHTANDPVVPVTDSLAMALAMRKAKRPFELHIYPNGPHGMALATEKTSNGNPYMIDETIAKWVEHAVHWAENVR